MLLCQSFTMRKRGSCSVSVRRSPTHGDQVLCDTVGQPSSPRWWPPHNGRIKSPGGYQTEFTKDIAGQMSQWNEFIGREEMKINVPVLVSRCNVKVNINFRGNLHSIEKSKGVHYHFHN